MEFILKIVNGNVLKVIDSMAGRSKKYYLPEACFPPIYDHREIL